MENHWVSIKTHKHYLILSVERDGMKRQRERFCSLFNLRYGKDWEERQLTGIPSSVF